jgi:hypothetical protein
MAYPDPVTEVSYVDVSEPNGGTVKNLELLPGDVPPEGTGEPVSASEYYGSGP